MHQAHVNTDTHSAYTAHIQNTNLCHEGRAMIEQWPLKLRVSERGRTRKTKGWILLGPCLSQCTVQLGPDGALMRGLQVSVTYGGVQSFYFRGGRGICAERFCCFGFLFSLFSDGGSGVWKKREKMFSFFILFLTHESVIRKKNKRHCVKIIWCVLSFWGGCGDCSTLKTAVSGFCGTNEFRKMVFLVWRWSAQKLTWLKQHSVIDSVHIKVV